MSEVEYRSNAPGVYGYSPAAVRNTGQRSNRYTWMMALRPITDTFDGNDGGTEFQCIDIPDDFYAVRVGFMNVTTTPWDVTLIKAVGSGPTDSYVVPVDDDGNTLAASDWSTLTSVNAGANVSAIVTAAGASTALEVLANTTDTATGETGNPAWTMTDWVPCQSRAPNPVTGMRRLMIRALIPSTQTLTYNSVLSNTVWPANTALNRGYVFWLGGRANNADYVTDPTTGDALTNTGNNPLTSGNIVAMVQVLTRKPCVQGMHTGDSTMAGTGTTASLYTMSLMSALDLGKEFLGVVPVSNCCAATGGEASSVFFARMQTLLPIVEPTYCILPGWTSNDFNVDGLSPDEMEAYFSARQRNASDLCREAGVVPIFVTPWGYDAMTDAYRVAWKALRARVLSLTESGSVVVDQFALCGNTATGAYDTGMASDGIHPNDSANTRATQVLTRAIKAVAGL